MDEIPQEKPNHLSAISIPDSLISESNDNKDNPAPPLIKPPEKKDSTIDEIINNGLCSKYPIIILICVYFTFIADGIEMTLMNLLIIPMKSYFNLSTFQCQCVAATLFLGVAIGSIASGWLSKSIGRISSIKFALFFLLISHLMMAISMNEGMFICLRIFIGFTLGIVIPISLSLYSEYIPIKIRGFLLTITWFFFILGYLLNGIIMYFEMPHLEMSKIKRTLMILTIFPLISFLVNMFLLADSPRNLILNNQKEKAFDILKSMNKSIELTFEEKKRVVNDVVAQANITTNGSIGDLFSKQYRYTTLMCMFLFFVDGCAFYGVSIITTLTQQAIGIELEEVNNKEITRSQIIIAFATLFSLITGGILVEIPFLGRKGVLWTWELINAIIQLPTVFFPKLFTFFMSISMFSCNVWGNVLITYIVEVYPTKLRDTSSGFLLMTFRISGFLSQFLYLGLFEIHYTIVYYVSTGLLLASVIATIILPFESVNKPLDIQYEEEKSKLIKNEIDDLLNKNGDETNNKTIQK